jgi:tetratricopeptide (TPR) repeat protein
MTELARLPANDRAPDPDRAEAQRTPRAQVRYYAFLSYSHKDEEVADWLHSELEEFHVPSGLAGKLTANGVIPKRLAPIFKDQHELAAADDLGEEIREALAASQFLIVLCSPDAARSRWTNAEIEAFKRTRPDGCVLAAIAAGEPFASEIPGREAEECFPPALRQKYDRRGRPTGKRAEPLAADLRDEGDGRRLGLLKLVAGMLGVGLDDLVQRETTRRHRRLAWVAAASFAGMAVTSTLAFTAIQSRDAARDQRRQAEGLIGFMLGDLKDKLEPIGKLDALDGVGSRVLVYYKKQDMSGLTEAALSQRSRALSLMAEVAMLRGQSDNAIKLYKEAAAGTEEAVRRNPDDPQQLFDHAQNVFWLGQIALDKGSLKDADTEFREYKRLADRMVVLNPDNMKWRMEVYNADANLGGVLSAERRFPEAAAQWRQVFRMIEALTTADPKNREYRQSLVESLAWYADAERDAGHIVQAVELREHHVALLNALFLQTADVSYRQRLIAAERNLAFLYAMQGRMDLAVQHARTAVGHADQLTPVEPDNSKWLEFAFKAKNSLSYFLLASGNTDEAAQQTESTCAIVGRLLAKDAHIADWRAGLRECWTMRGYIALANGENARAANAAQRAIGVAKNVRSADGGADGFALVRAYRLLGDARKGLGDTAGSAAAWNAALTALPRVAGLRPIEMQEHAIVLERVGRSAEARRLKMQLAGIGYRFPEIRPT